MLSKNNTNLYSAKLAPKHQKFAIKKFTVGVSLLGQHLLSILHLMFWPIYQMPKVIQ